MEQPIPWASMLVVAAVAAVLLLLEAARPLRPAVERKLVRVARNLTLAGLAWGVLLVLQAPLLVPLALWAERRQVGLLNLLAWPAALETAVAVLLLDYTLWHWHRWNHTVPFLWRFHLVHHVDRDLDASTALRFHFGEMALSVPYRFAQVLLIGASPLAVGLWQAVLLPSILFHHSNLRLPLRLEALLVRLVVTPRMHGIHHSNYRNETDSNFSSLLSVWDFLHRTILLGVPQREITIGVPAYARSEDVTLPRIVAIPFGRQRADWTEAAGRPAQRPHPPGTERSLAA